LPKKCPNIPNTISEKTEILIRFSKVDF